MPYADDTRSTKIGRYCRPTKIGRLLLSHDRLLPPISGQLFISKKWPIRLTMKRSYQSSEPITKPPVIKFCLHVGHVAVAPRNSAQHGRRNYGNRAYNETYAMPRSSVSVLLPPYVTGQAIIFSSCGFFFLSSFFLVLFSSPNLGRRRLDVYHTFTHDVALVRI